MIILKLSINWTVVLKTNKRPELNNAHLKILHEISTDIGERCNENLYLVPSFQETGMGPSRHTARNYQSVHFPLVVEQVLDNH